VLRRLSTTVGAGAALCDHIGGGPAMRMAKATRPERAVADETPNRLYITLSNHFQLID
jgi:hypothetical protein